MDMCEFDKIKDTGDSTNESGKHESEEHHEDDDHQSDEAMTNGAMHNGAMTNGATECDPSTGRCVNEHYPIPNSPSSAIVTEILSQMDDAFNGNEHRPTDIHDSKWSNVKT